MNPTCKWKTFLSSKQNTAILCCKGETNFAQEYVLMASLWYRFMTCSSYFIDFDFNTFFNYFIGHKIDGWGRGVPVSLIRVL